MMTEATAVTERRDRERERLVIFGPPQRADNCPNKKVGQQSVFSSSFVRSSFWMDVGVDGVNVGGEF